MKLNSTAISIVIVGLVVILLVGCESTDQNLKSQVAAPEDTPVVSEPEKAEPQKNQVTQAETTAPVASAPVGITSATAKPKPKAKKPVAVARRDDAGMLAIDRLKHDFGEVEPQKRYTTEFTLTNKGKQALELNQPKGSCSCTVPTLKETKLEPGASVKMPVTYKAKNNPGKVSVTVTVTTKAPGKPDKHRITLTSNVTRYITATPNRMVFQVRETAENPEMVLSSDKGESFKITGFTCVGQVAELVFDKELASARHDLELEVNLANLRKVNRGSITIRTDHPKLKTVNIYFTAEKAFVSQPGSRSLARLRPGETRSTFVTIVSNFGEEFEIGEITSKKGNIEVTDTEKTDDGYKIKFDFIVPADKKQGYVVDHLEVPIKGRENEVVSVRCYAQVRPEVTQKQKPSAPVKTGATVSKQGP